MLKIKKKDEGYMVKAEGTADELVMEWSLLTADIMTQIAANQKVPSKRVTKHFKRAFKAAKKAVKCDMLSDGGSVLEVKPMDQIDLMIAEMQ